MNRLEGGEVTGEVTIGVKASIASGTKVAGMVVCVLWTLFAIVHQFSGVHFYTYRPKHKATMSTQPPQEKYPMLGQEPVR
jgi:hypothetical protein